MRASILFLLPYAYCRVASEVIEAIQESRKSYSLKPLKITKSIMEISRDRAEELAESYEKYSNSIYLKKAVENHGIKMIAMGENNGKSRNKDNNAMDIFEEWLKSEKHKKNIIKTPEYTHLGVYIIKTEGNIYISAVFFQMDESTNSLENSHSESGKPPSIEENAASDTGMAITSSYMDYLSKSGSDTSNNTSNASISIPAYTNPQSALSTQPSQIPPSTFASPPDAGDPSALPVKSSLPSFNTIQLVYPSSIDVRNLPLSKFLYQPLGSEKQQTLIVPQQAESNRNMLHPLSLEASAHAKQETSSSFQPSTTGINPSLGVASSPNSSPSPSPSPSPSSNPNPSQNPNEKTIIKLIIAQPSNSVSNSIPIGIVGS